MFITLIIRNTSKGIVSLAIPEIPSWSQKRLDRNESATLRATEDQLIHGWDSLERLIDRKAISISTKEDISIEEKTFLNRLNSQIFKFEDTLSLGKNADDFITAFHTYQKSKNSGLGSGGSGDVFKVSRDNVDEIYAIKILRMTNIKSDTVKRFKNELFFCLKNNHKNIVTVSDYGFKESNNQKCPFYVMPFYEMTLRKLMVDNMDIKNILPIFLKILDGMEVAHSNGHWHRDLKPENILCDLQGERLVVADFGIAHFSTEELATMVETQHKDKFVNLRYSAPEQRQKGNARKVDHRADIFSLGLILNEMFTQNVPQGTAYKTIMEVEKEFEYLDPIVAKMIHQNPENRYQNVSQIKLALKSRQS